MTLVHVLRVFTDEDGRFGNPLGVVLDSERLTDGERQRIAAELGFSETVFIDDVAQARLRIFTLAQEIALGGHPLVGTAWLLAEETGRAVDTLRPLRAANVATWREDGVTWIRARIADAPEWSLVQLGSPNEVEALTAMAAPEDDLHEFWAWQDEGEGRLRARVFGRRLGIVEDEATGSGALRLVGHLQRRLVIQQGLGSLIYARPAADGRADVGGRVVRDGTRNL